MILHEKIPVHYLQTKNKCANAIKYGNLRVMSLLAFGFRRVCNYEVISNNLPPSSPFFNGFNKISKTCRILCLSESRAYFLTFSGLRVLEKVKEEEKPFSEMEQKPVDMRLFLRRLCDLLIRKNLCRQPSTSCFSGLSCTILKKRSRRIGKSGYLFHGSGAHPLTGQTGNPKDGGADTRHTVGIQADPHIKGRWCNPI